MMLVSEEVDKQRQPLFEQKRKWKEKAVTNLVDFDQSVACQMTDGFYLKGIISFTTKITFWVNKSLIITRRLTRRFKWLQTS